MPNFLASNASEIVMAHFYASAWRPISGAIHSLAAPGRRASIRSFTAAARGQLRMVERHADRNVWACQFSRDVVSGAIGAPA